MYIIVILPNIFDTQNLHILGSSRKIVLEICPNNYILTVLIQVYQFKTNCQILTITRGPI